MNEEWKPIEGTDERYEVSNYGRVRTLRRTKKMLTLTKQKSGYLYVMIEKDGKPCNCRVSRLVALHFIPNPDNLPEVNHIDGNKENNTVTNLEWSNRSLNMKHASRMGLINQKAHAHRWTDEERRQISEARKAYFKRLRQNH